RPLAKGEVAWRDYVHGSLTRRTTARIAKHTYGLRRVCRAIETISTRLAQTGIRPGAGSALSRDSLRHLEEEPGAALRLVNERLQNTCRGDVAALLADRVRCPLRLDQVGVVVK